MAGPGVTSGAIRYTKNRTFQGIIGRLPAQRMHVLLLMPFFVLLLGLLVAPLTVFLSFAFRGGPDAWIAAFARPGTTSTVIRTVVISLEVTGICAILAYIYVGGMLASGQRVRSLLLYAVLVPFFTSVLVRTYAWIILLSNTHIVTSAVRDITGVNVSSNLLYNRAGVLIGMVHVLLPLFVLPLYAVARRVPADLNPAARTLGASRVEAFLAIDLPLSLPGAAAGAVLVFITALGFYITPALLGGSQDVMVAQAIERGFAVSGELSVAAALSLLLVIVVVIALVALRSTFPLEVLFIPASVEYRSKRRRSPRHLARAHAAVLRGRQITTGLLNAVPWAVLARIGTWAIVFYFVLPLVIVIPVAFSGDAFLQFPPSSYSLRWYEAVWQDPLWRSAALNSISIGALSVVIAGGVGLPVAFSLSRGRYSGRIKASVLLLAALPMIIPIMVLAVAIFVWYLELGLIGNRAALAAAHAVLGIPFVVVLVTAALRDFDVRLEKAARTLGAGPIRAIAHITFRIMAPAIASALLFAFLMSFDELLIARGVARIDTETLPIRLWNGAREEISPALAVISTVSMTLTIMLLVAANWANRVRRNQGPARTLPRRS